jgi:CubicO group peptidase (beta-lactamase class C family)
MEAAFGVAGEMPGTDVHGHVAAGAGWAVQPASAARQAFPEALNPIGLMLASAPDWGRFLQLHLNAELGQGGLVLSPEQAQFTTAPMAAATLPSWR